MAEGDVILSDGSVARKVQFRPLPDAAQVQAQRDREQAAREFVPRDDGTQPVTSWSQLLNRIFNTPDRLTLANQSKNVAAMFGIGSPQRVAVHGLPSPTTLIPTGPLGSAIKNIAVILVALVVLWLLFLASRLLLPIFKLLPE